MNELILHIGYLMRRHDCVIVPGIGAFIASVQSAYSDASGIIHPPLRTVTFNHTINHNDGLLEASYSRRMYKSREDAAPILAEDIECLRNALDKGTKVNIGQLGTLHIGENGCYEFDADIEQQWFPTLNMARVLDMARADEQSKTDSEYHERVQRISTYLRRIKVAASIAVVLALGFVLSTPSVPDNAQYASPVVEQFKLKTPSGSSLLRQPGQQAGVLLLGCAADTNAVITADTAAIASYKTSRHLLAEQAKRKELVSSKRNHSESGKYCLVVASLNNGNEAGKFINDHRPMQLHVIENDGRYRVYAISGRTINEVKQQASATGLLERFPGAWVCKK